VHETCEENMTWNKSRKKKAETFQKCSHAFNKYSFASVLFCFQEKNPVFTKTLGSVSILMILEFGFMIDGTRPIIQK